MVEILKPNFVKRLGEAIKTCWQFKKQTDANNADMQRAYVSGYTKKIEGKKQHPMNMVDRIVSIWLPFLIGGLPKVVIKPKINLAFQPFAYTFQLALNQWMKEVKFDQRTLEPAVFNSLFNLGIVKTGTQRADKRRLSGYMTVTGRPFSEIVDLANYVFDVTAMDREQYEFEGDEYLLPTKEAKERFPKHADKIKPDFKLFGEGHPKDVSEPEKINYAELQDYTAFIDVWLPKQKVIKTMLHPFKDYHKFLATADFRGCDSGPYDVLGYKYYRGSTIPVPPVYSLMEMDAAINTLYSKARNQAERLKNIGVGEIGNEKDAETARDATDGDFCIFQNAQGIKDLKLGGVTPEIYEFLGFSLNQLSEQAGVTGLDYRSRSKTATQEQMLMANASRQLNMMSQRVHLFAKNIIEKLAYEMWLNPTFQIYTIKKMAGVGEVVQIYNQLQQKGKYPGDYYLDVEMYSMQQVSANDKFQSMMQMLTGFTLPMLQQLAQQGKILNAEEIHRQLSTYKDLDTESWFLSEMPQNTQLNPYQVLGTSMKSSDQRFGASQADNANNMLAQLNSRQGTTTRSM
jgi:hypothetical protein